MKKLLYFLPLVMFAMTSCDWFELDNMEGHNAQVEGAFIDSKTGEPVGSALAGASYFDWTTWSMKSEYRGGVFKVYEQGWDAEEAQDWFYKNNGTYVNKLVWAGEYKMRTNDANFFPIEQAFTLTEGKNKVDFTVTPYARIIDETITYDEANGKIIAKFKFEAGDPTVDYFKVNLFCFTDRFVCNEFNNVGKDAGTVIAGATPGQEYTLTIDMKNTDNVTQFQYERTHYVRIGVLGQGGGMNFWGSYWNATINTNGRYNYSPVYAIGTDGTVKEVTEW